MLKKSLLAWHDEGQITIPYALITGYKQLGLNEQEVILLIHIFSFIEKGNDFPTPEELSNRMTINSSDCSEMLSRLIQKGFINIIDGFNSEGIRFEKYSLQPLLEKVIEQFLYNKKQEEAVIQKNEEADLYTCFEQEFGRPLSPFECETLGMWLDDDRHDPTIITAALREAVISGKLNFRYIDRILFEWKKNGIRTIEQAKIHGRKFRQYQTQQRKKQYETSATSKSIPFYNWLSEDRSD
ncbi:DnaD domain-containing protein [Bacillus aquiflavi]|uniref:DnaD domain-containing protein n=1 Tax=Bacillus aquiflavi TaxID=2672567 RepID=A0A6B3VR84_9BACI|nr:DnaD domain-containing protein [Bacillus aquiflavi]MBA4536115.1 DnaD domain-containing protein [Bacillus aquiflavi]NEY80489.1 DnaD domain-containing protein [Bacillus aquiflavi]UAC47044.1 DnaD domain-containing protein [Bacillus aquiflavi]